MVVVERVERWERALGAVWVICMGSVIPREAKVVIFCSSSRAAQSFIVLLIDV